MFPRYAAAVAAYQCVRVMSGCDPKTLQSGKWMLQAARWVERNNQGSVSVCIEQAFQHPEVVWQ